MRITRVVVVQTRRRINGDGACVAEPDDEGALVAAVGPTTAFGCPAPAARGWACASSAIRDAHGNTAYRWGLIPTA